MCELPTAVWEGSFFLGDLEMKCYVLSDGRRIIDADSVHKFIEGAFGDKQPTEAEIIDFAQWQTSKS